MALLFAGALAAADRPEISAAQIVNAADYRPGAVAPSEVIVLYASHVGPDPMAPWALDPLHMTQYSVNSIGGTRVLFDGVAAPMVYAENGRLCAIVPYAVGDRRSTDVVVEYQGERSAPVTLPVAASAPALFTLDATGAGQAAMLNYTGCCNSVRNPSMRGEAAVLYATGEGLPLPGSTAVPRKPLPVKVSVGGVPAQILWSGNVGLLQVNFRVPLTAPMGDAVPLSLTVGDAVSAPGVTMAVRSARQRILVVAADAALRRRLTAILSPDFEVAAAPLPSEAPALSYNQVVDLVIADLTLPFDQNLKMLRAIRATHQQAKTIALADPASAADLKSADLLGAQAVLEQPLDSAVVLRKVRDAIVRRAARY